ncbi:unnamed protein product [Larinioides sclopetarius]|uniref:Uncharacterized protein n=1 Tax=Larinioides sclopetarius TaxID=280406 RepID=A0AAV1ZFW3_9ARAC
MYELLLMVSLGEVSLKDEPKKKDIRKTCKIVREIQILQNSFFEDLNFYNLLQTVILNFSQHFIFCIVWFYCC